MFRFQHSRYLPDSTPAAANLAIYKNRDRDIVAVAEISLTIGQGEFAFIVGSRGAGKSTLLNVLSGNAAPSEGAVYLDGAPVPQGRLPDRRRGDHQRRHGSYPWLRLF